MVNFKKVLNSNKIKILSVLLFFLNISVSLYAINNKAKTILRNPLVFSSKLSPATKDNTSALASNPSLNRRTAMFAIASLFTFPLKAYAGTDFIQSRDVVELFIKAGFSEKISREISQEIVNLGGSKEVTSLIRNLSKKNISIKQLFEQALTGNTRPLIEFLENLRNAILEKGYLDVNGPPKKLIRLLAGPREIFDFLEKSNIPNRQELFRDFTGCTPKSMIGFGISRYIGIEGAAIAVAPDHTFGLIPLSGTKYLLADFTTSLFEDVDMALYYDSYESGNNRYYSLKHRVSEERLLELKKAFKIGGLALLRGRYKITKEELLNFFYSTIYIPDIKGLAFTSHINAGVISLKLGLLDKARQEFQMAETLNNESDEVYIRFGIYYTHSRQFTMATESFNKAISLNPNNPLAYINRGVLYYIEQNWEEARKDFERSVKLGYVSGILNSNLAMAYYNLGRYNDAISQYRRAIQLEPEDAMSYYGLGAAYYELSRSGINNSEEIVYNFTQAIIIDDAKRAMNKKQNMVIDNISPLIEVFSKDNTIDEKVKKEVLKRVNMARVSNREAVVIFSGSFLESSI